MLTTLPPSCPVVTKSGNLNFLEPSGPVLFVNCITNSCIWNTCVTWQGIDYKLLEDDTILSKHVGV